MSVTVKPLYSAALINLDDGGDLGPPGVPDAKTDGQARDLATKKRLISFGIIESSALSFVSP